MMGNRSLLACFIQSGLCSLTPTLLLLPDHSFSSILSADDEDDEIDEDDEGDEDEMDKYPRRCGRE